MQRLTGDADAVRPDAASCYHLAGADTARLGCVGTACFVARHLAPGRWEAACAQGTRVACLGQCFAAPATPGSPQRPHVGIRSREAVVLPRLLRGGARTLASYRQQGGYAALARALSGSPEDVLRAVEDSKLRGRGGAGFPTGRKWRSAASQPPGERFVVANADEGDAGAYVDRFLLEDDPHAVLEGMMLAAFATGASRGWIYLRREYPAAAPVLGTAIAEARAAGLLGPDALGRGRGFDVVVHVGQGGYACGEETALLRSLEGLRPEVMARPPYATERGLHGRPTVVNNVETLANVPWIVLHGADAYRAMGFSRSRGTKVLSLGSLFRRPGLYEVEFGIPVREVVEELGGGLRDDAACKGVLFGGPLAGIIPPSLFDTPVGFEELRAVGASLGHGGVVAFDDRTSIRELLHHVFAFAADESCGKCTPCRLGSRRAERLLSTPSIPLPPPVKAEVEELVSALALTSLCGLGTGLAEFAASAWRHYPGELTP